MIFKEGVDGLAVSGGACLPVQDDASGFGKRFSYDCLLAVITLVRVLWISSQSAAEAVATSLMTPVMEAISRFAFPACSTTVFVICTSFGSAKNELLAEGFSEASHLVGSFLACHSNVRDCFGETLVS